MHKRKASIVGSSSTQRPKVRAATADSYGIRPTVNLARDGSLFGTWDHRKKSRLEKQEDTKLLAEYVDYCVAQINQFLGAVRASLPKDRWTPDKRVNGLLTTTVINGLIICLRKIVERKGVHQFNYYKSKLTELNKFEFSKYKSSQYGSMGVSLYETYFDTRHRRLDG